MNRIGEGGDRISNGDGSGEEAFDLLARAGVYEPDAADAATRRTVLERLLALGAPVDDVIEAGRRDRLRSLAVERLVHAGRRLSLDEVADLAGATSEDALRLWRAWGFSPPEARDRRFGDADVEMVRFALAIESVVGRELAFHTARVMGIAIGRIAEAEVAMLRGAIEAPLQEQGASEADVMATYEALIGEMLKVADDTLTVLHRHHIIDVIRRHEDWDVPASADNVLDTFVGFADLTGSTRLASELSLRDLDRALATFEERATDVIAVAGASLVKRIGDAVMFVTPAAAAAARVALDLVDAFSGDPIVPPVRVGLAGGQVVARRGDFYGLPVILAFRLLSVAAPSTALVSDDVRRRLEQLDGDTWTFRSGGERMLAGFSRPVPIHELRVGLGS